MPLKHNLTTTLHGLVTISELFAGFNLINTGVLNCLIMCQNARKMHHSEAKKSTVSSPDGGTPPTLGIGTHSPHFGAQPGPPNESPGSGSALLNIITEHIIECTPEKVASSSVTG